MWIVGSPRTGTTWLLRMLGSYAEAATLDEPQIGTHLGLFSPDLLGLPAEGLAPLRDHLRAAAGSSVDVPDGAGDVVGRVTPRASAEQVAETFYFAAIDPKDRGIGKFAGAATPGL